jgi:hypothetical protein
MIRAIKRGGNGGNQGSAEKGDNSISLDDIQGITTEELMSEL